MSENIKNSVNMICQGIVTMYEFDHLQFQKQWKFLLVDILVCLPGLLLLYTDPESSNSACFFSLCLHRWKPNFTQQRIVINYAR